jgi:hypothetical protein
MDLKIRPGSAHKGTNEKPKFKNLKDRDLLLEPCY